MTILPSEQKATERKILEKTTASTSPDYGVIPDKRPIAQLLEYGIVVVNKPKGPTSHQVSAYVQRILGITKSGHSGTLDPSVTGVLPVALGRATKVVQALLPAGKEYVAIMQLHQDVDSKKLQEVVDTFTGTIKQLPPVRSAIKRQPRERTVYYIDILEQDGREVLFRMGCEAGTYVRKWIHDVGLALGGGAHMQELVRTKAGPFNVKDMVSLQDLQDAWHYWKKEQNEKPLRKTVLPLERAVEHVPAVWVHDSAVDSLCHGALLHVPGVVKLHDDISTDDVVAVKTLKGELICLGVARMTAADIVAKERGAAVRVDAVFMRPGTYPKKDKP